MDDLVQFLRDRLDETTVRASAATPGPWSVNDKSYAESIGGPDGVTVVGGGRWGGEASVFESTADALHIAEHDPARVLAEIDAKRQLIVTVLRYESKIDGEWGCCHSAEDIAAGRCEETDPNEIHALQLLALPYAGHPDFREEWRP